MAFDQSNPHHVEVEKMRVTEGKFTHEEFWDEPIPDSGVSLGNELVNFRVLAPLFAGLMLGYVEM